MQFFDERERQDGTFTQVSAGQQGTLAYKSRGAIHRLIYNMLGGLMAEHFSEFRVKLNNSTFFNVDGEFLKARQLFTTGIDPDEEKALIIDFQEPNADVLASRFRTSLPVSQVRLPGFIEQMDVEVNFAGDAPETIDLDPRSIHADNVVLRGANGQEQFSPAGDVRTIESFPVVIRNGTVTLNQFTEGGINSLKQIVRRVWFKMPESKFEKIEIRDDSEVRSDISIPVLVRDQESAGLFPLEDWTVIDPVLDRDKRGYILGAFTNGFNVNLEMKDLTPEEIQQGMTVYVEYDGRMPQ